MTLYIDFKPLKLAAICSIFLFANVNNASAQMKSEPWGFNPQNRASIAALMQQIERPPNSDVAPVSADSLVCGGSEKASARANSTCIILNNALGNISIGQDANGDQTATSDETSVVGEGDEESDFEEVLSSLNTLDD